MTAIEETTIQTSALLYESYAETETAEGYRAWNNGRIKAATSLWLSAARWSQYARAYTCSTGAYTVEQIEGEACARCGQMFTVGEASRPTGEIVDGAQLFAHVQCPKRGATR
ncbi:MAG: hypothetical protein YHS30scaffold324_40 [Catenulispora phage 69_17]|nr:MAG: hypothetical protein YHS30scaffold324_40 [Catenulispora phage 69_17]